MAIYFLRHGESEANVKGLFAGQREDSPLSELGLRQAREAGEELANAGIQRIVTSSLKRTIQTAEEAAKAIGFKVRNIEMDMRIIEYDMGTLTGTPIRKVTSKELVSAEGAENPGEFKTRVLSFLGDYKNTKENILMISHAGVGRIIESSKRGLDPNEFYDLHPYPNAHAVKLDLTWL